LLFCSIAKAEVIY